MEPSSTFWYFPEVVEIILFHVCARLPLSMLVRFPYRHSGFLRESIAWSVERSSLTFFSYVRYQQVYYVELLAVKGVTVVGCLPAEVQRYTAFSAGIATSAKNPVGAEALIHFLSSPDAAPAISRHSEYAGVPKNWVHVVFQDYALGSGFTAGEPSATAALTLLMRSGRSPEYKRELIQRLWKLSSTLLKGHSNRDSVLTTDLCAGQMCRVGGLRPRQSASSNGCRVRTRWRAGSSPTSCAAIQSPTQKSPNSRT